MIGCNTQNIYPSIARLQPTHENGFPFLRWVACYGRHLGPDNKLVQDPEGDNYAQSKTNDLLHPSHNEEAETGTFRHVKKSIKLWQCQIWTTMDSLKNMKSNVDN
jgi:hypothetical protein